MLEINDILTSAPGHKTAIAGVARVLCISDDGETVALIELDERPIKAPYLIFTNSVDPDIEGNGTVRVSNFDPCLPISKDALSFAKRKRLDEIIKIMEEIMGDVLMIMDSEYRGRQIARVAKKFNIHGRTVRRYFYDYLWGGMIDLAFCGPQKPPDHKPAQQKPGSEKRGPKRRRESDDRSGSLPITAFREKLEMGARRFYFSGRYSEQEAFVLTKKAYFSNGKKAQKKSRQNIPLEELLLPSEQLPSPRQFHYVISILAQQEGEREGKPRQITPARTRKERRGRARTNVPGPGYRYEIDATKVQIRIVSRFDRSSLIREATLYIIIDVWSGAIVGYALSLKPASWFVAAAALKNCFTDKGEVFKRLGLPYESSAWISQHLPTKLAADRGELVSNKAGVVPEIGIEVEIMASLCPERKGTVEGKIEAVKHSDNFYLKPGAHKKNPGRREKNGKADAAFTLQSLEKRIVEIILDLNNDPVPVANMPVDAVNAGVSAITYGGLFAWGLKNRAGFTRKLSEKTVTNELMLRDEASVTPNGIRYRKQNYTSNALLDSGLMAKAAAKGNFSISIRYDDLIGDRIRYYDPRRNDWVDAFNDNPDVLRLHASFWEIESHLIKAELLYKEAKENNISNKDEKAKKFNLQAKDDIGLAKDKRPRRNTKQAINTNTDIELAAERSRRLLEEQQSIAAALATQAVSMGVPAHKESDKETEDTVAPTKSIGQRALELWRGGNENLDK